MMWITVVLIRGVQTQNADAMPVLVDSAGQLGTGSSSQRYKKEINPMKKASESIHGCKAGDVSLQDRENRTSQFGLIAE
jgi:hypothetical protein